MANKSFYWVGSTGNGVNNYNFNHTTNWRESVYSPSKGTYEYRQTGYAPGRDDYVMIANPYGPTAFSPCLWGGFTGTHTGGSWIGAYPDSITGGTTTSSLRDFSAGNNLNYFNYLTGTSLKPLNANYTQYVKYPFPYIGGGITGEVLDWLLSSGHGGWTAGSSTSVTSRMEQGLRIKSNWYNLYSLGYPDTTVDVNCVKSIGFLTSATGATAPLGVKTGINIYPGPNRSGAIKIKNATAAGVGVAGYVINTGEILNHQTAESVEFYGLTADQVNINGHLINTYIDENSRIGKIDGNVQCYNGPFVFGGLLDRKLVVSEIYSGLSGASAGATGIFDSSMYLKAGFQRSNAAPSIFNQSAPNGMFTKNDGGGALNPVFGFTPSIYIGIPGTYSSSGSLLRLDNNKGLSSPSYSTLCPASIKFASGSRWNRVEANSAFVSASWATQDGGLSSDQDIFTIPNDSTVQIQSIILDKGSTLDLSKYPNYNNWVFGTILDGVLNGGIYFADENSNLRGSKDMRMVNDTVIANGSWSNRTGRIIDIINAGQLPFEPEGI